MQKSTNKRVWVLTDERPGNRTQAIGVAQKLPFEFEEKNLNVSAIGKLPNAILRGSLLRYDSASRAKLEPPWPDIAIAAGRKLIPALQAIKKRHPACYTTYLMHPRMGFGGFDLVAVPEHDSPAAAPNLFKTVGAVHSLTSEILHEAGNEWRERLTKLASPRIALLVGGNSKSASFQPQDFHDMGELASKLARRMGTDEEPGSLLVTTSPRTDGRALDYLRLSLAVDHELFVWERGAENPYHGFLQLAHAIVVTGDSMSMCAEACSLGKPVFIYIPRGGHLAPKLRWFHQSLFDRGLAQPLLAGVKPADLAKRSAPLDEASRVAGEILKQIAKQ